jgi:adenosine deaminase CECR1
MELYDSILLGTKRIGHGFSLAKHPKLIELVKERDICVESCPVSNFVLGYVKDLRCHPARGLLAQGVKVSLSPDDQGFWDAKGATLDYLYAYLAWDLSLNDLKQLIFNSLEYASVDEEHKIKLLEYSSLRWKKFLTYVRNRY